MKVESKYWLFGRNDKTKDMYEIQNINGCYYTDSVKFTPQYGLAIIDAGNDQTICESNSVTLSASAGFSNYNWCI